ncbi:unnamed protein product, partial [Candidula unifasciata]
LNKAGRPVVVSCSGESKNSSCLVAAGRDQFCPATSKSNSVSITIKPEGSVSICQRLVRIKNHGIGSDCGFSVRLSEPATGSVTVSCSASPGLLDIRTLTIPAGNTDGRMTCLTLSGVAGSQANVTCRAQGAQFTSGTVVDASTALFIIGDNTVSFQPAWSQIYNTTFTSFFYLNEPVDSGTVKVLCQASVVSSMDEAARPPDCSFTQASTAAPTTSTTTTTTTTTTVTTAATTVGTTSNDTDMNVTDATTAATVTGPPPTTLPDPSSDWRVVNSQFELSRTSTSSPALFQSVTTERVKDVISVRTEIVVTTCCVLPSGSLTNYHNRSAVSVAVAHLAPFVCAGCKNISLTNPKAERTLQNPGFVEVAPCACDLTQNGCDINCCCDSECSKNERARFSGCVPGLPGGQETEPEDYRCSSVAFDQPDWQTLTCVYWENNWFLGLFYKNARKLQTLEDINAQVARTFRGRFSFSETERRFSDPAQPSYTYGAVVRTIREDIVTILPTGTLTLPQPGPGASCNPLTPVRYLVDQASSCTTALTQQLCSPLSILSAGVYLASSAVSGCSQSYKVARSATGNQVAPTDVYYYCASGLELCPYVNMQGGLYPNCVDYNRNRSMEASPSLPGPCSWDDSFTTPPVLDGSCANVVVDVRYNFEWKGSEITKLSAVVILADLTTVVNKTGLELVQQFSVKWLNKPNTTVPLSDNFAGTSQAYTRSGSAGYMMGKPLLSGQMRRNTSTGQFDQVDVALEKQMAVWRPGLSGLCRDATRQPVTFGDDVLSGCVLNLSFNDLNNSCDDLRQQILDSLDVLMAADVIGRYGYNDISNENMWVPVLRQALNISSSEENSTSISNTTSLNETVEELQSWANSITGVCLLPSAASLHILYAQTGAANGYPRYEVLGAYIHYTITNFTMDCMGANSGRCQPTSGSSQQFLLSSSVTFTLVPATPLDSRRRFDTRCNPDSILSDTCYRYFTDFGSEECYYGTCWQELAYPLLSVYQGDPRVYALPFFLVLVLGVIGYVSVARPGWR